MHYFFPLISGISKKQYCRAVNSSKGIDWQCQRCTQASFLQSMMPAEATLERPLAAIIEYNTPDDSSDMELDFTINESSTGAQPSTTAEPSFTADPSLTSTDLSIREPVAHSSMADSSDSSMPSFDDLDVSLPSFDTPDMPAEESIDDSLPLNAMPHTAPTTEYTIVPNATKFGFPMLTDNRGYSYTKKQNSETAAGITNWRCTKRNPGKANCHATVRQEGNNFSFNGAGHTCTAEPGIANTLRIKTKIKSTAVIDIFTSTAEITERILQENINNEPAPSLPGPVNLSRAANQHRQHLRPKDPATLDFDLTSLPFQELVHGCHQQIDETSLQAATQHSCIHHIW